MSKSSKFTMTSRLAVIYDHCANDRERLESLFPVARELIERAMVIVKDLEDGRYDMAQHFANTLKDDAQTFLDATRLLSQHAHAADYRRLKNEMGS
jgi:hypothetical protein